eukprot:356542-Chlamydomonas_euryale.AAC.6
MLASEPPDPYAAPGGAAREHRRARWTSSSPASSGGGSKGADCWKPCPAPYSTSTPACVWYVDSGGWNVRKLRGSCVAHSRTCNVGCLGFWGAWSRWDAWAFFGSWSHSGGWSGWRAWAPLSVWSQVRSLGAIGLVEARGPSGMLGLPGLL